VRDAFVREQTFRHKEIEGSCRQEKKRELALTMDLIKQQFEFGMVGHNSLAHLFHILRVYRNVPKEILAKKFHVSETYLSGVESGLKRPSLSYWLKCGKEFGANPNWIKVKFINERSNRARSRLEGRLLEKI
jgi:hypothetical protein